MTWNYALMNPPYSNKQQYLDVQFVEEVNKICNKQVVIHPAKNGYLIQIWQKEMLKEDI